MWSWGPKSGSTGAVLVALLLLITLFSETNMRELEREKKNSQNSFMGPPEIPLLLGFPICGLKARA